MAMRLSLNIYVQPSNYVFHYLRFAHIHFFQSFLTYSVLNSCSPSVRKAGESLFYFLALEMLGVRNWSVAPRDTNYWRGKLKEVKT